MNSCGLTRVTPWLVGMLVVGFVGCSEVLDESSQTVTELQSVEQAVEGETCSDWCREIGNRSGDDCYASYSEVCGGCPRPACGATNRGCQQPHCAQIGTDPQMDCFTHPMCAYCEEPACAMVSDHGPSDCQQPMCESIGLTWGDHCLTYPECSGCEYDACADITVSSRPREPLPDPIFMCIPQSDRCREEGTFEPSFSFEPTNPAHVLAVAGDINGDGFDDLLVGDGVHDVFDDYSAPETVLLYYGPIDGPMSESDADAVFSFADRAPIWPTRESIAGAGDVNGDGFADILIGIPSGNVQFDDAGSVVTRSEGGVAFLLYGAPDDADGHRVFEGEIDLGQVGDVTSEEGVVYEGARIYGRRFRQHAGSDVAAAGDVDGDGFDDILIGAFNQTGTFHAGHVYLLYGGRFDSDDRLLLSGAFDLNDIGESSGYGYPLGAELNHISASFHRSEVLAAAGDVDQDGCDDVLLGSPDELSGHDRAFLLLGGGEACEATHPSIQGAIDLDTFTDELGTPLAGSVITGTPDRIGWDVSTAGDVDDDGFDDVLVATRGESYLIYGPLLTNVDLDDIRSDDPAVHQRGAVFPGGNAEALGDIDGDCIDDYVLMANHSSDAIVIYGDDSGGLDGVWTTDDLRDTPPPMTEIAHHGTSDSIDLTVGDFDGDGISDAVLEASFLVDETSSDHSTTFYNLTAERSSSCSPGNVCDLGAGLCRDEETLEVDTVIEPTGEQHVVRLAIANVDGDAYDDLLVTIGDADFRQKVLLFYGPVEEPIDFESADASFRFCANSPLCADEAAQRSAHYVGSGLANSGDIDGDGFDDILIGLPDTAAYFDPEASGPEPFLLTDSGVVFLIYGGIDSDGGRLIQGDYDLMEVGDPAVQSGIRLEGAQLFGRSGAFRTGQMVAAAGDVNGDGLDDFLVTAPGDRVDMTDGEPNVGLIYLVYGVGNSGGRAFLGQINLETDVGDGSEGTLFGARFEGFVSGSQFYLQAASAGDVNDDGYSDILLGAPDMGWTDGGWMYSAIPGTAYLYHGGEDAAAEPSLRGAVNIRNRYRGFVVETEGPRTGQLVSAAGDVDADGYDDFFVANSAGGTTYLVYGPLTDDIYLSHDLSESDGAIFVGSTNSSTLTVVGDVDGDGVSDFVVPNVGNPLRFHLVYGDSVRRITGSVDPNDTSSDFPVVATHSEREGSEWVAVSSIAGGNIAGNCLPDIAVSTWDGVFIALAEPEMCSETSCAGLADGTVCDDGDLCTTDEQCLANECVGIPDPCETSSACEIGECTDPTIGCEYSPAPADTECRASDGPCDVSETCTGESTECPTDQFVENTHVCRVSTGVCDVAESCTGDTADCPADQLAGSTYECRGSTGVCDVAESCTGESADCPADQFAPSAQECREAASACDEPEYCTGDNAGCPEANLTECSEPVSTERCRAEGVIEPDVVFEPVDTWRVVSVAGDINGDGVDDLLIGDRDIRAILLYYGPIEDTSSQADADAVFRFDDTFQQIINVSGAGDVNGDGFDDILISYPFGNVRFHNDGFTFRGAGGVVFLLYGAADSTDGHHIFEGEINLALVGDLSTEAEMVYEGARIYAANSIERAGYHLAAVGDVDGDGFGDFLIGGYAESATFTSNHAYLLYGGRSTETGRTLLSGVVDLAAMHEATVTTGAILSPFITNATHGDLMATAGDVNGDGCDEILFGSPDQAGGEGEALLLLGGGDSCSTSYSPIQGNINLSSLTDGSGSRVPGAQITGSALRVGVDVSSAGDVDGDGYDDLLVVASGVIYLIYGPLAEDLNLDHIGSEDPAIHRRGAVLNPGMWNAEPLGDIDGDGLADILIGAGFTDAAAMVVYGNDTGALDGELDRFELQTPPLGAAVIPRYTRNVGLRDMSAGDLDGDGFGDAVLEIYAPIDDTQSWWAVNIAFANSECPFSCRDAITSFFDIRDPDGVESFDNCDDEEPNPFCEFQNNLAEAGIHVSGELGHSFTAGHFPPPEAPVRRYHLDAPASSDGEPSLEFVFDEPLFSFGFAIFQDMPDPVEIEIRGFNSADVQVATSYSTVAPRTGDSGRGFGFAGIQTCGCGIERVEVFFSHEVEVDSVTWRYAADSCGGFEELCRSDDSLAVDTVLDQRGEENAKHLARANIDGDEYDDLLVTVFNAGTGGGQRVLLFYGPIEEPVDFDAADASFGYCSEVSGCAGATAQDSGDEVGEGLAGVGDVDGDGYDDILIGSPRTDLRLDPDGTGPESPVLNRSGVAFLIYGGVNDTGDRLLLGDFDLREVGDPNTEEGIRLEGARFFGRDGSFRVGGTVAAAGDVNGDCLADMLISASSDQVYSHEDAMMGLTYLVYGAEAEGGRALLGPIDMEAQIGGRSDDAWLGVRFEGLTSGSQRDIQVASAGDVNADGYDDFLVGAPDTGWAGSWVDSDLPGAAYLFYGGADTRGEPLLQGVVDTTTLTDDLGQDVDAIVIVNTEAHRTGDAVAAAGDVNDDGFDDVLVHSIQVTHLLYGPINEDTDLSLISLDGVDGAVLIGSRNSRSSIGVGDVDGDGADDLVIPGLGQPLEFFLVYGDRTESITGTVDVTDNSSDFPVVATLPTTDTSASAMISSIVGGDFGGNCLPDIAATGWGSVHLVHAEPQSCPADYCVGAADGSPCDDGSFCTVDDQCQDEVCIGTPNPCDDGNVCTNDYCDVTDDECVNPPVEDSFTCDEGNLCSIGACVSGTCESVAVDCSDDNECTTDSCDPTVGCTNTDLDGSVCGTADDLCVVGVCEMGSCSVTPLSCDDDNECTVDSCDPLTGCVYAPLDETACMGDDLCVAGTCRTGVCVTEPVLCDDGNECTANSCDPAIGCVTTELDGSSCMEVDLCVVGTCMEGACATAEVPCDDGNICTNDTCDPEAGCLFTNNADPCDDSNACTFADQCYDGVCGGDTLVCGDYHCTDDACDTGLGCVSSLTEPSPPFCEGPECAVGPECEPPEYTCRQLEEISGADVTLRLGRSHVGNREGYSAQSIAIAGDVNGDGYDDLLIGDSTVQGEVDENWNSSYGAVFLFYGPIVEPLDWAEPDATFWPEGTGYIGADVAGVGDVNGDGFDDIVIGGSHLSVEIDPDGPAGPLSSQHRDGVIYLIYGGLNDGLPRLIGDIDVAQVGSTVDGARFVGVHRFATNTRVGDINGDCNDDIVLIMTHGPTHTLPGDLVLLYGGTSGGIPVWNQSYDIPTMDFTAQPELGARFILPENCLGTETVAGAGDIDGDQFADLLIGFDCQETSREDEHLSTLLVYGGLDLTGNPLLQGDIDLDDVGYALRGTRMVTVAPLARSSVNVSGAGDVDGDHFGDILLGLPDFNNEGKVLLLYGLLPQRLVLDDAASSGFGVEFTSRYEREPHSAADINWVEFGASLSSAGDVDGDGLSDFLLGGRFPWSGADARVSYLREGVLIYGSTSRLIGEIEVPTDFVHGISGAALVPHENRSQQAVRLVAGGGDINGDCLDDIVLAGDVGVNPKTYYAWVMYSNPVCQGGFCAGRPEGAPCFDGDLCTASDVCLDDVCVGVPVLCSDGNDCTADSCDSRTGCFSSVSDGATCDASNLCTTGYCEADQCVAEPVDCDDRNECTANSCDSDTGCTTSNRDDEACDETNLCTVGTCEDGGCSTVRLDCDDGNECTLDSCDSAVGCINQPLTGTSCQIANLCVVGTCAAGVCDATEVDCDDDNPCTDDSCKPSMGCMYTALHDILCDDSNLCTEAESCVEGVCIGTDVSCDDGNSCTVEACDPDTGCEVAVLRDGTACDDEDACTLSDKCFEGECISSPLDCDDDNSCTFDTCSDGACWHMDEPVGTDCSDDNACTARDSCWSGMCVGSILSCDDRNQCTANTCDADVGCEFPPLDDGTDCEDGSLCTVGDACSVGVCEGGADPCDTGDPCTGDCDEDDGGCIPLEDGSQCDELDGCQVCQTGVCSEMTCGEYTECGTGECIDGACDYTPLPASTACTPENPECPAECVDLVCEDRCVEVLCNGIDDDGDPETLDELCSDVCNNGIDDDCDGHIDETDLDTNPYGGCVGYDGREDLAAPGRCFDDRCNRTCFDDCFDNETFEGIFWDSDLDGLLNEDFDANCRHMDDPAAEAICEACSGNLQCETSVATYIVDDNGNVTSIASAGGLVCDEDWVCTGPTDCDPQGDELEVDAEQVCRQSDCQRFLDGCNGVDDDDDGRVDEDSMRGSCHHIGHVRGLWMCLPTCDGRPQPFPWLNHIGLNYCIPDTGMTCRRYCSPCPGDPERESCDYDCR